MEDYTDSPPKTIDVMGMIYKRLSDQDAEIARLKSVIKNASIGPRTVAYSKTFECEDDVLKFMIHKFNVALEEFGEKERKNRECVIQSGIDVSFLDNAEAGLKKYADFEDTFDVIFDSDLYDLSNL